MAGARDIKDSVKHRLYTLSGCECANPFCSNKLVSTDSNTLFSEICHIEAASPDGPRYNPNQTDEERRDFDNLILLCERCHKEIDNPLNKDKYTVEILKKWKKEHGEKVLNSKKNKRKKVFSFSVPEGLLPRDAEVEKLYNGIKNNRFFNLVGVGGSGKSSLTYLMMQKHKDDFNEIAYVVVNGNIGIKESIVSQLNDTLKLEFEKDDDVYKKVVTYLEENFKSENHQNLLVLDVNALSEEVKDYAGNISKLYPRKWNVLIISREYIDQTENIENENLNTTQDSVFLKELFLKRAGERYAFFDNFNDLFETIFYNPLLSEQLGFYLSKQPETKTLEEIRVILKGSKFKNKDMKGLAMRTNDNRSTIIEFLKNLIPYDTNYLNQNEKELLRHFVLWPVDFIHYKAIKELLNGVFVSDDDLSEALSNLSDRAILMVQTAEDDSFAYKLHGLLTESLREQIDVSMEKYTTYKQNAQRIIEQRNKNNHSPYDKIIRVCYYNSLCIWGEKMPDYIEGIYIQVVSHRMLGSLSNDAKSALFHLNKSIEIGTSLPKIYERIQYALAYSYRYLALFCKLKLHNYESAKDNFIKEKNIREHLWHNAPESKDALAWTYFNIADLQSKKLKDYESAKWYYIMAIGVLKTLPYKSEYRSDLAEAYSNFAVFLSVYLKDYESAQWNYNKAIGILKQLPNKPEFQHKLAKAYNSLADLQLDYLSDVESSQYNYNKTIEILKVLPNSPEYQSDLAQAYDSLADLLINYLYDYKSAKNNYIKEINVREKMPKDNFEYQDKLATAYNNLALLIGNHFKDYKTAQSYYDKSIALSVQLPKDNFGYQDNLATTYCNLAVLQAENLNDYESANVNYCKAIGIGETLPNKSVYKNSLALAYNSFANFKSNYSTDYESVRMYYNKAIEIWECLPKNILEYYSNLAIAYTNLAELQADILNDHKSAYENYSKAINIFGEISKNTLEFQDDFADVYDKLSYLKYEIGV